ncbi:hypothetical protein C8A01DRAFT_46625 [Parachaetomium inaequale]|uniref:Uncharacterized protein n=1 Tax=Parachaetomium inaequale TaxID=2588326 RepID=A0AAN6PFD7_9PEZI|nr:hypothetical protein C8A01DRAFT_46625 [Parachaetomium inaequale]
MEFPDTHPLPPPLERLPLDLFHLFSLSLASRFCYQAATPQGSLACATTCRNGPQSSGAMISFAMCAELLSSLTSTARATVTATVTAALRSVGFRPRTPPPTPQHKQEQHETWLPFAQFLSKLPGLTDLVYSYKDQVPACVLAALHRHHPRSHLHIGAFSLRSLYQARDQLHDIDPDELAVATSPCLYSIFAKYETYDEQGRFGFNLEALEQMVSGWAPNLKRAQIHHSMPSNWRSIGAAMLAAPRPPWKGFSRQSLDQPTTDSLQHHQTRPNRGCLETLTLSGAGFNLYNIEAWKSRTDFGALRRFELNCSLSLQAFQALASMAAQTNFHSLREFGLAVYAISPPNTTASLDEPASQILQAVPQLEALKLSGCFGRRTFEAALRRHGQTLQKLSLIHCADDDDNDVDGDGGGYMLRNGCVRAIQQRCPRLEDVRLHVRRRGGGPDELPRLRRAVLWLDCRVPPGDVAYRAETIRKAMANCAVDEALARAIFQEMAATASAPLQRLKLETDLPVRIVDGLPGFRDVATWIGRSWVCTRDETRGEVMVRETTDERDSVSRNSLRGNLELVDQECKDAWGEIWPPRAEESEWRDDWRSFPLRSGE